MSVNKVKKKFKKLLKKGVLKRPKPPKLGPKLNPKLKLTSGSLKHLHPPRITKKLRGAASSKGDSKSDKRDPLLELMEMLETKKLFNEQYLEYIEFLSTDSVVTTPTTVKERQLVLGKILDIRFDHELIFKFLADVWNVSLASVKGYAKTYYAKYADGLPFDKIMATRKAIKEYNQMIQIALNNEDYKAANNAMAERNKLMGLEQQDYWKGELTTEEEEKTVIVIPDNKRGRNGHTNGN